MLNDFGNYTLLTSVVYGTIEVFEKLGLSKKYAHLLAIPLGIIASLLRANFSSVWENIVYGVFIGLGAMGTCDTVCNIKKIINKEPGDNIKK